MHVSEAMLVVASKARFRMENSNSSHHPVNVILGSSEVLKEGRALPKSIREEKLGSPLSWKKQKQENAKQRRVEAQGMLAFLKADSGNEAARGTMVSTGADVVF
ncbi:uncharacterized protein G2W53_040911 [Senna tora]|uniref:Uncharacterized protein n=1 Tax=Senna tora TaxID=362788 RepID=A0A834VYU1_9FABA|nr:uncharacterized protein G2W53_040911 [Senna tora]